MKLSMQDLRDFKVPAGSLTIWWLGQASFIVKSPDGIVAAIDPYLSNACKEGGAEFGFNMDRLTPAPISPEELCGVDLIAMTHSHGDHFDPETIVPYRQAGGNGPYLAPAETIEKLRELDIPDDQLVMTWPNREHTVGDITFRATLAIPFGGDDLTHIGYLVAIKGGPKLYLTGDTGYHEVMGLSIAEHKPDLMLTAINGAWRSLDPSLAARLAGDIKPKVVIPYHYDLFPDGQMHPENLKHNLFLHGLRDTYRQLEQATPYTYPEK